MIGRHLDGSTGRGACEAVSVRVGAGNRETAERLQSRAGTAAGNIVSHALLPPNGQAHPPGDYDSLIHLYFLPLGSYSKVLNQSSPR